jgi:hypothetical protein
MLRGESSQPNPVHPLLPRSIFDKEARRKAVAVSGAAMELVAGFGPHGNGKEVGWVGLDKAGRLIPRTGNERFCELHASRNG